MQKSKACRQNITTSVGRHVSTLLAIALFAALALVPSAKVSAQVECLGACEEKFARCLGIGDSPVGPDCQQIYEACVDACLGGSAVIFD